MFSLLPITCKIFFEQTSLSRWFFKLKLSIKFAKINVLLNSKCSILYYFMSEKSKLGSSIHYNLRGDRQPYLCPYFRIMFLKKPECFISHSPKRISYFIIVSFPLLAWKYRRGIAAIRRNKVEQTIITKKR